MEGPPRTPWRSFGGCDPGLPDVCFDSPPPGSDPVLSPMTSSPLEPPLGKASESTPGVPAPHQTIAAVVRSNPRLMRGLLNLSKKHCEKGTRKVVKATEAITVVPGGAWLLRTLTAWHSVWSRCIEAVSVPLGSLTDKAKPFAEAFDESLSHRIVRAVQSLLDNTLSISDPKHEENLVASLQCMQRVTQLEAQLRQLQHELREKSQNEQDVMKLQHLVHHEETERARLQTELKQARSKCEKFSRAACADEGRCHELELKAAELESKITMYQEELIQVESYQRSEQGATMKQMEEDLAASRMRLVDCEAEKDDLEMELIITRQELEQEQDMSEELKNRLRDLKQRALADETNRGKRK